jgi:gliding motility-associated-like protein
LITKKDRDINHNKQSRSRSGLLLLFLHCSLCFLFSLSGFSQLEYSRWHWLDSNQLDFSTSPPTQSQNGSLTPFGSSGGGCASICDRYGNLIFTFNPRTYIDKNNDSIAGSHLYYLPWSPYYFGFERPMIVPMPCNDTTFFCLAQGGIDGNNGYANANYLVWNKVYLNANQEPYIKDRYTSLDSNLIQSIDVTRHANNRDYWIVVQDHEYDNQFKTFLISDTGISTTPVVSTTGPFTACTVTTAGQDLIFSPDGTKLVLNRGGTTLSSLNPESPLRLYNFDNATGQVSFQSWIEDTTNITDTLNNLFICFSADSRFLYMNDQYHVWQYDLINPSYSAIVASRTLLKTFTNPQTRTSMELALDSSIYISTNFVTSIVDVIKHPDRPGLLCEYTKDSLTFIGGTYSMLPRMIDNYYVPRKIVRDTLGCTEDTLLLAFNNEAYLDSAWWFVGAAGFSPQQLFVSDSSAAVVIDSAGLYPIMAVTYSGCRLDTFYDTVTVLLTPAPNLGPDTILCEGDTIAISNDWAYSYLWNTGDTTDGIQILLPDTYWLELSNYCGVARDTVIVDSIIEALVVFPALDTLLCLGDTLHLDATVDFGTYTWHDGSTDSVFAAFAADTVWATAINACGTSSDTISVRFTDVPELPLLDSILCVGDTQFINLITDSLSTFLWYSGDTIGFDSITTENTYWVQETNLCGSDVDSFFVAFVTPPVIDLGADTVFCGNSALTLDAETRFGSYVWSTGDSTETFTINAAFFNANDSVSVFVTVTNACSSVQDSILLVADFPLNADLGNDTVVCVNSEVVLNPFGFGSAQPSGGRVTYLWQDFSIADLRLWTVNRDSTISVSVTNTCGTYSDEINILKDDTLKPDLGPDSALCFGDTIVLRPLGFGSAQPAEGRVDFLWQDMAIVSSRQFEVGSVDSSFFVTVTNACGSATASASYIADSLPEVFGFDTLRFCDQGSVEFQIPLNDRDRLFWSDGDSSVLRTLDQSKNWTIRYINHCGESREKLIVVRQYPPIFRLAQTIKLCENEVELLPNVEYSRFELYFDWSTGEQTESIYTDSLGYYQVTVSDDFGCADSAEIRVITCGASFYAPNAFTPDNDNINDSWDIEAPGMDDYQMAIYDRWGNEIYSFTKGQGGWDGTVKGEPAPSGVYLWLMTGSSEKIQYATEFTGKVTLIR